MTLRALHSTVAPLSMAIKFEAISEKMERLVPLQFLPRRYEYIPTL
jgi:hypothetical protein